jgi:hypothetical protein
VQSFERKTALLVALAVLAASPVSRGAPSGAEDELKSATILLFLRHATWPEKVDAKGPITVGVVGRSSFAQTLRTFLDGKSVNGRAVRTVELKPAFDPRCCQAIYFAADKNTEIRQALQETGLAHTLTIGDADRFIDLGGAVNLLLVDGHMAFEVSLEALDRAGIEISSKLLRLGQIKQRRTE